MTSRYYLTRIEAVQRVAALERELEDAYDRIRQLESERAEPTPEFAFEVDAAPSPKQVSGVEIMYVLEGTLRVSWPVRRGDLDGLTVGQAYAALGEAGERLALRIVDDLASSSAAMRMVREYCVPR